MNLEELEVYRVTMEIGERVWKIVGTWDFFAKDTVGKQFVKAADSMAANISEGFGRFFYKENKQFGYYARGSLFETKTWLTKAHNRGLVEDEEHESLQRALESIAVRLNNYIRSIGSGPMSVREDSPDYGTIDAPQAPMTTNDAATPPMTLPNDAAKRPMTPRSGQ